MTAFLVALALVGPPRVAIDTVAAKQLVAAWQARVTRPACLLGYTTGVQGDPVIVIDSVSFAGSCPASAVGVMGFLYEAADETTVLEAMASALQHRVGHVLAGMVVGLERVPWPAGGWGLAPHVWAAVRGP